MKQYIVDAFTQEVFSGNPAAVCVMEEWIPEETMGKVARENNLSETAFAVKQQGVYKLRWFTPGGEVDLCGHATLATAYVIMRFYDPKASCVSFETASGTLVVRRKGSLYEMELPAFDLTPIPVTEAMRDAIGMMPREAYMGRDLLCVLDSAHDIKEVQPDMGKVKELQGLLLHVTAKGGNGTDCVSRSFAPKLAVPEDPVCGSGHCHIVPYWANRLGKSELVAYQASKRGGTLYCRVQGAKVYMAGHAALFAQSEIFIQL